MKKVLFSIFTILLVVAVTAGATFALFSDEETSSGNTFTAGTLDLKVGNQDDPTVVAVTKTNMVPQTPWTYQGYNNQWVLKNAGSVPGTVTWKITNIKNLEHGCNEPETSLNDTSCGQGDDQGELGEYTWVKWNRNQAPWGGFGSQFNPFNSSQDVVVTGPVLQPGETLNLYMWLDFPYRNDNLENLAQGDSMSFDVEFTLTQVTP